MNRNQALAAMKEGKRVSHRWFSNDEYLYMENSKMFSEEGYRFEEGWEMRKGDSWEEDWDVVD